MVSVAREGYSTPWGLGFLGSVFGGSSLKYWVVSKMVLPRGGVGRIFLVVWVISRLKVLVLFLVFWCRCVWGSMGVVLEMSRSGGGQSQFFGQSQFSGGGFQLVVLC